jgi:hypothetical protein
MKIDNQTTIITTPSEYINNTSINYYYNQLPAPRFGSDGNVPMLEIKKDGFYVRGVRVNQDEKEAEIVYNAFHQWLTYNTLTR